MVLRECARDMMQKSRAPYRMLRETSLHPQTRPDVMRIRLFRSWQHVRTFHSLLQVSVKEIPRLLMERC